MSAGLESASTQGLGALIVDVGFAANIFVAAVPFVAMVVAVYIIARGLDDGGRPYDE